MTAHCIKTLLSALLSYCLIAVFAGAVLANAGGKRLVSAPGVIRREPFRGGEALAQTPGSGPEQQAPPAGKRKSMHEYGPEDVHPEARENENSGLRKDQASQPKARARAPLAPRSIDTLTPTLTPTLAPAVTPAPTVTMAPTPAESSVSATATTRSAPQKAAASPAPQKVKTQEALRRKLLVNTSIFLSLLLALAFFVIKMRRQLRADRYKPQEAETQYAKRGLARFKKA